MSRTANLRHSLVLAPLLGVTDSLVTALALWMLAVAILGAYGVGMAVLRPRLLNTFRLIGAVILAASLTTCAQLAVQVWSLELQQRLGLYLGLIALQCLVLEYNGFFQQRLAERVRQAGWVGALLIGLGLLREVIGHGTLGSHLAWLAGVSASNAGGWVLAADGGLRLAVLVPGGLLLLGLLFAARQAWTGRHRSH